MMELVDKPVYARPFSKESFVGGDETHLSQEGITFREWLIGQALVGAIREGAGYDTGLCGQRAINAADSVLALLEVERRNAAVAAMCGETGPTTPGPSKAEGGKP